MKLNKFVSIGLVAAITAMAQPAFAGATEDFVQPQGACVIPISDSVTTRLVNIEYIRLIQLEKQNPKVISISMGSNYYNSSTSGITMTYATTADANKALVELSEKINNCQYAAAKKRNKM